jgi:hypothetical protein
MNKSRIVSLLIFLVYLGFAISQRAPALAALPLIGMLFIWFPSMAKIFDQMGIYKKSTPMDPNTPSCIFVMIGWVLMLGPAIIGLIAHIANS